MAAAGVCITSGLVVGHCCIKEATPHCCPICIQCHGKLNDTSRLDYFSGPLLPLGQFCGKESGADCLAPYYNL